MHPQLKAGLVARQTSTSWPSELPWVLLGLRSIPLEASGVSSVQFLSTLELPPYQFFDNLHRLMDPFIQPFPVHGSLPFSGKVHLPSTLWELEYFFLFQCTA